MINVKTTTSNALDSKGVDVRIKNNDSPLCTFRAHSWSQHRAKTFRGKLYRYRVPGFTISFSVGRGAGYIGGLTFFVAMNARGGRGYTYGPGPFIRAGLTRTGGAVPYSFA